MGLSVSVIASGLALLSFQGVTVHNSTVILATIEADLLRICPDGRITKWVNLSRHGIPTGVANLNGTITVAISAQESGHFLLEVTPQGEISTIADLSELAGEFGAPFSITLHQGYYPYYLVSICTDVLRSGGVIVKVTPSGQVAALAKLPASAFGIVASEVGVVATQDDGFVRHITPAGKVTEIVNLAETEFGIPFGITQYQGQYAITTTSGWLIKMARDHSSSESTLLPLVNLAAAGFPLPTSLTAWNNSLIVATGKGKLLRID